MTGKAAEATTVTKVLDDLSMLRQDVEALRRASRSQQQQDALSEHAAWKAACSAYLALPGLRGFWPMSSFDDGGDAFDLSGQGRTLSYNGDPTYNYDGLAPYIDLDGTGDYLSRVDEAGLDILGNETYVDSDVQGLTAGGWFWVNSIADPSSKGLLSKWTDANQRSWYLLIGNYDEVWFGVTGNSVAIRQVSIDGISAGTWYFIVGTYDSGVRIRLFVDAQSADTIAPAIPVSLFNSNAPFLVGSLNAGASLLPGRAAMCFLCAANLSDAIICGLFAATRGLFRKW